jgi:hypothetical protein
MADFPKEECQPSKIQLHRPPSQSKAITLPKDKRAPDMCQSGRESSQTRRLARQLVQAWADCVGGTAPGVMFQAVRPWSPTNTFFFFSRPPRKQAASQTVPSALVLAQ